MSNINERDKLTVRQRNPYRLVHVRRVAEFLKPFLDIVGGRGEWQNGQKNNGGEEFHFS